MYLEKTMRILLSILVVIWFAHVVVDNCFYKHQIIVCDNCPDISNHFEHSLSHVFEEFFIQTEWNLKIENHIITEYSLATEQCNINKFVSSIWQPPKYL